MDIRNIDSSYVLETYARNYTHFVRGDNSTLFDINNSDYIDFTSGIGVVSVGHGNSRLATAIAQQAAAIIHTSNLYAIEPQALLAEALVKRSGYDMQCFFANSGAEANEGAIKIARKYGEVNGEVKRYKIITLDQSFHGRTISALKATGQESMHAYFGPFPDGFSYAANIASIEAMIDSHTVAVMVELVQGEGGIEALSKNEMQSLAKMLKERDVLLIVDEVQTGIYRTGELLASNIYEIEPDIITLAKGLGGGVPIGAIMSRLKNVLKVGDHGSTFGGNFLSSRASLEVLNILNEEKRSGALDERVKMFSKKLESLKEKFPQYLSETVGFGLMRGVRVKDAQTLSSIVSKAHENRVLVLKAGRNTLRLLPPLTVSENEINNGFERLGNAFNAL